MTRGGHKAFWMTTMDEVLDGWTGGMDGWELPHGGGGYLTSAGYWLPVSRSSLPLRVTSHTRLRACHRCASSTPIGGNDGPVQVRFTLCLRDPWSKWMQDGSKVYMYFYMASSESCFMVTWIVFKNHFLEVGLSQNKETMALRTLTIVGLFYFIMCEDLTWIEVRRNSIWLRVWSHMTSHYTWGPVTTLRDSRGVLGRPLDTFFWALTISWSRLLARVWSAP